MDVAVSGEVRVRPAPTAGSCAASIKICIPHFCQPPTIVPRTCSISVFNLMRKRRADSNPSAAQRLWLPCRRLAELLFGGSHFRAVLRSSAADGATQLGRKRIVNTGETQQNQTQQDEQTTEGTGSVPEPTEEHREKAKKMAEVYDEDRPTVTLPGSDGTVSGTAINDWLDDDGNPVDHGNDSQDGGQNAEGKSTEG
jgi:hypothetical protein